MLCDLADVFLVKIWFRRGYFFEDVVDWIEKEQEMVGNEICLQKLVCSNEK